LWVSPTEEFSSEKLFIPQVRKPERQDWFRLHPNPNYRVAMLVLKYKPPETDNQRVYLLSPNLRERYAHECSKVQVHILVLRSGQVLIYLMNCDPAQHENSWNTSARKAMEEAEENWVRMASNVPGKTYDVTINRSANFPKPVWPKQSFAEIMRAAFGDRYLTDPDHPILKDLDGRD
jgi:hypothetical protein